MTRFYLSPEADLDLDEIKLYLNKISHDPAKRIAQDIKAMLLRIAENPYLGVAHSDLTRFAGQEVRSRPCGAYRIFYRVGQPVAEIVAILHTARDSRAILAKRLQ